jgi:protein TonB
VTAPPANVQNNAPAGGALTFAGLRRAIPAPTRDRIIAMLLLAGLLHGIIILGVTFTAGPQRDATPGMEVTLVTDELPEARANDNAAYLAQRAQHGSGNTQKNVRLASPPSSGPRHLLPGTGQSRAPGAADTEADQAQLHTVNPDEQPTITWSAPPKNTGNSVLLPNIQVEAEGPQVQGRGDTTELVLRGTEDAALRAAPDTRAMELAPYLVVWRQKVERVGTLNYPHSARQQVLKRNPILEVTLKADGTLSKVIVLRSSGAGEIDQAALGILRLASPFDPLPRDLSDRYKTLRFAYEWQFVP